MLDVNTAYNPGMRIAPFLLVMTFSLVLAQAPPTSIAGHPDWPKANHEDVKSVDAIVAAIYDVISGPTGKDVAEQFSRR